MSREIMLAILEEELNVDENKPIQPLTETPAKVYKPKNLTEAEDDIQENETTEEDKDEEYREEHNPEETIDSIGDTNTSDEELDDKLMKFTVYQLLTTRFLKMEYGTPSGSDSFCPTCGTEDAADADYLFGGDTELVEIDGIDVGNVTSGLWLNLGTTSTKLQTVKNVDAHSATSITVNSYCGSRSITNVADWDVSGMTAASSMFYDCTSLVSCTGFLWPDAAIPTSAMFRNCTNLTTAEISSIQSSNATYMFYGCSSLTAIPEFTTTGVTVANYMLTDCSSLESIPNIDYSNLTNIEHIFENCTGLTNAITISLDSVTFGNSAFNGVTVPLTISNLDSYTNSYSLINDYDGPSLVVNSAAKLAASNATTTPTSTSGYYYGLCLSKRVQQNDTNALRTVEIYNTPL